MSQELNKVPDTPEEMADALRRASEQNLSVLIRGAGTKIDWGRPPQRIDTILSTRGLRRILAHQHGDLTATIEAGASLREVNLALALHKQWLPLDPSFAADATIGGILATNDSGPLRHRHGTPRDLVIGTQVATADGLLAKSGGQVVKNVAGYDLSKLLAGSFGSLAAIVSATFKLSPLPATSKTLIVTARDAPGLARLVRDVMASHLEPIAFEAEVPASSLLLRFASARPAVEAQADAAQQLLGAGRLVAGDEERVLWQQHNERIWSGEGAVVRSSWLPSDIATVAEDLESLSAMGGIRHVELVGRAAIGTGLIRIDGDPTSQSRAIDRLRRSASMGNVVLLRGSSDLKALVDVWGSHGDREPVFASLKRAFDPKGILNAGRGPL